MSTVGTLVVDLILNDQMTAQLEKALRSLKQAEQAMDGFTKAQKNKKAASDEATAATDKDTKTTEANAQANQTESKSSDKAATSKRTKKKATDEAAQATEKDSKAAQENAGATEGEAKSTEKATTAKKGKAKANQEDASAADKAKQSTESAAGAQEKHGHAAQAAGSKLKDLQSGLQSVAMQLGVMSAALLYGAKTSIDAFNELRAAGQGLATVASRTGQDAGKVNEAAKQLSSDGLMTLQESSTSLKNLLASGFNLDQAINLINTFRDSAAFGRQSSLQFGEAVQTATEGVKNGNSVLVSPKGLCPLAA